MLVEQSSGTTQTSTVATFVRSFFGAPGFVPQIINNFKAGDQNHPKQPWKDFRHSNKLSTKVARDRRPEGRLWRFSINRIISFRCFCHWTETLQKTSAVTAFVPQKRFFLGFCWSEQKDWHWFSTQAAAVSCQSFYYAHQPQYHNQILHGLKAIRLYGRQGAGHVR